MGVGHSPRCKSFDHAHGARTAIDVIAQENRHGMVERPSFHIGLDALGHLPEQVVTAMNIAHAVHPSPIRDTTRQSQPGAAFSQTPSGMDSPTARIWWSSPFQPGGQLRRSQAITRNIR